MTDIRDLLAPFTESGMILARSRVTEGEARDWEERLSALCTVPDMFHGAEVVYWLLREAGREIARLDEEIENLESHDETEHFEGEIARLEAEVERREAEVERREAEVERREAEVERLTEERDNAEEEARLRRDEMRNPAAYHPA